MMTGSLSEFSKLPIKLAWQIYREDAAFIHFTAHLHRATVRQGDMFDNGAHIYFSGSPREGRIELKDKCHSLVESQFPVQ